MKMFVNISKGSKEFTSRTDKHLNMMQNHQRNSLKKIKRYRSAFTTEQVNYLEEQYRKYSYINNSQRKEVAFALNIPERAVKIWFQNRRMKEKRESINKEFSEETDSTSSEFAKDQLNNVMKSSANDQQPQSLPLLTDIDNVSENKTVITNHSTFNLNIPQSKKPEIKVTKNLTGVEIRLLKPLQSPATSTTLHKPISANDCTKSEKVSLKLDRRLKLGASHHSNITPPTSDIKPKDKKQETEDEMTTNLNIIDQMIPEDLSNRKDVAPTANPTPSIAVSTPGYIQMLPAISPFYSEPYFPASGVLWKPVSVVPNIASNGASVSVHIPKNVSNLPKKCCKCECHEPLLSYNIQQSSANPQYIFTAVPLTNPSTAKL
ncbi:unnamed protein product [Arctia plantaginis]|uniref:Homeobox domain-containing protein n=1 Tax=Arctia plantaginis TaxID=874455 RepID=A0A8S0ZPW5_ARCPL|nr:unnamed protein product [Arctia plantaginis]